mgnify:CR=1 FL=1
MARNANLVVRSYRYIRQRGIVSFLEAAKRYTVALLYTVYWAFRFGVDLEPGWLAATSSERRIFEDLFANLRVDDVFYDVGADEGLFTCPVASTLETGRVVAFEPGSGAKRLERRLQEAGLEATIVEKAVSHRGSEGYNAHEGRVGFLGDTDAPDFEVTNAREILDGGELPLPTVVKIDVYGAETDVTEGLKEILARDECRLVYLELHLPMAFQQRKRPDDIFEAFLEEWSLTDVVQVLLQCGFEVEPIYMRNDTNDLFIRASKPRRRVSNGPLS